MIHHVSLELDEHDAAAEVAFWELLGFAEIAPPGALAERARWVERGEVQLHLVYAAPPSIPRAGHIAIVLDDYDAALTRLRAARHAAAPRTEHFGSPRTQVRSPAGHLVELMAPPPRG